MFFLQIANKSCSMVSGAWLSSADDDLCSMLFLICEKSGRYPWIRLMLSFICWKNNVRSFTFSKLNCWKPEFGHWTLGRHRTTFTRLITVFLWRSVLHAFAMTISLSRLLTAMKESGRRSTSDRFYNFQVYPKDSWIF